MASSVEAVVSTSGALDGLDRFMTRASGEVLLAGVAAMARVVYDEVILNVTVRDIDVRTGALKSSIYRVYAEDKSTEDSKLYRVSWNRRKAPHGHLLEFGTSRAPAKPFIRPAADRLDEALKQGQERIRQKLGG